MYLTNYVLLCITVALVLVDIPDHLGAYLHAVHEAYEHTKYVETFDGTGCQSRRDLFSRIVIIVRSNWILLKQAFLLIYAYICENP
jgi:hypothetical protein